MNIDRGLAVLEVCLPVFAVMGLGKVLALKGLFGEDRRDFVNALVYWLALPALIFHEVARQRLSDFLNPAVVVAPIAAIATVAIIFAVLARVLGYRGGFAATFVFGAFWANVTYMGLPLCRNAFGDEGLALAAVYNAVVMPVFVALSFAVVGLYGTGGGARLGRRVRQALLNPVMLAAFLGIIVAACGQAIRGGPEGELPPAVARITSLIGAFLQLVGSMGLPLALLAIGASLEAAHLRHHRGALALSLVGKLLLLPAATWLFLHVAYPEATGAVKGVAVLMGSLPNAVASYVIAKQLDLDQDFVGTLLIVSTVASTVTVPLWVYCIL
jgi:predicted permease